LGPMESLVNKLPFLSKASIALQKIETLGLSLNRLRSDISVAPNLPASKVELHLRGVTHTYRIDVNNVRGNRKASPKEGHKALANEEHTFTLGPVDLSVCSGELIFIVGGNGSGKSTLAKLLSGLYYPQSGQIWLNGEQVGDHNQAWYRQHFSAVFSDFYLFDRLLGFEHIASNSSALDYLKKLRLDHKVKIQHGKFSTTALSQGQRKRLALLGAFLENRPIYLFDEWAADQDPSFKRIFYTQILSDLKASGKIIFVISHDDRYFHLADRLIKLDYGSINYNGPPQI
ncbi:MAG: cyclic peptide export ABC transporter, partial [Cyanobacteria bacterium J06621_11]